MTTAKKMMIVIMFMLEQLLAPAIATAVANRLPDYECGARMDALTSPPNEPCQNTTARSALLTPCFLFLNHSSRLPSPECCAAVLDVWPLYPACFCFLTFFPPMVPDGGDRSAFHARPLLCNLTGDLCGVCPGLLFTSSNHGTFSMSSWLLTPCHCPWLKASTWVDDIVLHKACRIVLHGGSK